MLDSFTGAFVVGVLDNPVYAGKIAYGRRRNEKKQGTRNEYHVVMTDDYMLHDSIHAAIVSEKDWQLAHARRKTTHVSHDKIHSLEHEHILTGLLKCPVCGGNMYGNVNRKKKGDVEYYKDYFYYACKHRLHMDSRRCDYHHQWGEEIINDAVADTVKKLVQNTVFNAAIRERIGKQINTEDVEKELDELRKRLRQLIGTKDRIGQQIDALEYDDPHYNRKYQDLQERHDKIYDEIAQAEACIADTQAQLLSIQQQKISSDNVFQFLLYFDKLYDHFTDAEKKEFMAAFIERIEIYPERLPSGRILKHIDFRFPVFYKDQEITGIGWDNSNGVETVFVRESRQRERQQNRHAIQKKEWIGDLCDKAKEIITLIVV